jgi:hypothetical protein
MTWVFDRLAENPALNLSALLLDTFGADHRQAGGWLARKWHLPKFVVEVIEHHHDPDYAGEHPSLVRLVGFSSCWASSLLKENIQSANPQKLLAVGIAEDATKQTLAWMTGRYSEIAEMARLLAENTHG